MCSKPVIIRIDKDANELLPELITHCHEVKEMDDLHGDLYLFGGSATKSWISPWQASELATVKRVGEMLGLTSKDVVLDLGCGDGRVNLTLSRLFHCRGYGWDSSQFCINTAELLLKSSALQSKCTFHLINFLQSEEWIASQLDEVTVLFAYLPVQGLETLRPLLEYTRQRNPNVRLVTNHYHFPDFQVLQEEGEIRISKLV